MVRRRRWSDNSAFEGDGKCPIHKFVASDCAFPVDELDIEKFQVAFTVDSTLWARYTRLARSFSFCVERSGCFTMDDTDWHS
jgi:hypothetical protein